MLYGNCQVPKTSWTILKRRIKMRYIFRRFYYLYQTPTRIVYEIDVNFPCAQLFACTIRGYSYTPRHSTPTNVNYIYITNTVIPTFIQFNGKLNSSNFQRTVDTQNTFFLKNIHCISPEWKWSKLNEKKSSWLMYR